MSQAGQRPLPKFKSPPVTETILDIGFSPLAQWDVHHYGLFWDQVKDEFPRFETKVPVPRHIEEFGERKAPELPRVQMMEAQDLRGWLIAENQRLIQLQRDRFIYNWRKDGSGAPYPQYEGGVREEFIKQLFRFVEYVSTRKLGQIDVVQCELTYLNQLEIGKGWQSAADFGKVFTCWENASYQFLPSPEGISFDIHYRMPENVGRLHVSVRPAFRNSDGTELLRFTLTARGMPADNTILEAIKWLDMAREWIVRAFADLTTPTMHKIWERTQ
jgi:uncharacterized protein (TIGR04255 family)